jgi:hypothetical protein
MKTPGPEKEKGPGEGTVFSEASRLMTAVGYAIAGNYAPGVATVSSNASADSPLLIASRS